MVVVGIASLPDRERQLKKTVESLIDQVDLINICLNNYTYNPFEGNPKVNAVISDNRHTDAGKFMFLENYEGYYFSCDDDIIYPPTYIEDTIPLIDMYGIVSYHGRAFQKFPVMSYYKSAAVRCRCLDDYDYTEPMQIVGTGVASFHTKIFKPLMSIFKTPKMSDIYFSIYADSLGLQRWVIKHKKGYFKYMDVPNTIYDEKVYNCDVETRVINNYFSK
jgi:hypothetical protein